MSKKIINQNHKETAEWVKIGSYFFIFLNCKSNLIWEGY